jgi:hypothetical protein
LTGNISDNPIKAVLAKIPKKEKSPSSSKLFFLDKLFLTRKIDSFSA